MRDCVVSVLIDSGSPCSIMRESIVRRVGGHCESCAIAFRGFTAGILHAKFKTTLTAETEDVCLEISFYVVVDFDLTYETIVGRYAITSNDVMFETPRDGTRIVRNKINTILGTNLAIDLLSEACSPAPREAQDVLLRLLGKYPSLIATGNRVRVITTGSMKIKTTTDVPATYCPYRLAPAERAKLRDIIEELLISGIIRNSISPYASPVIIVKKQDGSDRLCVDFSALNRVTLKHRYPLPLIDDQLDRLGKGNYFTTLDMASGFHQIPIQLDFMEKNRFCDTRRTL